ncbi:hypothetical protein TFLX_00350 [Thermoflexales bacterium]|nr:hypothetical protein TFLX_00350 [Thermoflexales bacterium]
MRLSRVKPLHRRNLFIILTALAICLALDLPLGANAATGFQPKSPADYANIVYIDPSTSTPGNGSSPATPLASWNNVTVQPNTAYVQKRGTIAPITKEIRVNQENVLLGAYGPEDDPRPIISDASTNITHLINVQQNFVTVRDLEIVSPRATSGIHFAAGAWPSDGVAWNCYVHGVDQTHYLMWGIRVFGHRTKVLHNTIAYTGDDGIFVQYFADIEIGYNHITHVNQKWFEDPSEAHAGGDGIQFDTTDRFYIHHNYIDRSDTGNKFCIIVDPKDASGFTTGGLIEHNACKLTTTMSGLFAGGATAYTITIRNNVFEYVHADRQSIGVYSHARWPSIYNNIFIGLDQGINLWNSNAQAKVQHNVFYNLDHSGVRGNVASLEARNNIFAIDASAQALNLSNVTASHNLFLRQAQVTGSQAVIGDPQFVNPASQDFHLQPGSPAIDAGVVVPEIDRDAENHTRIGLPDIGAFEFQPALRLFGQPRSHAVHLTWTINVTPPVTSTWRIAYYSQPVPLTISNILSPTRAHSLTGLTNYAWYTITLNAMLGPTPVYTDTIKLLPTDRLVHLPVILK